MCMHEVLEATHKARLRALEARHGSSKNNTVVYDFWSVNLPKRVRSWAYLVDCCNGLTTLGCCCCALWYWGLVLSVVLKLSLLENVPPGVVVIGDGIGHRAVPRLFPQTPLLQSAVGGTPKAWPIIVQYFSACFLSKGNFPSHYLIPATPSYLSIVNLKGFFQRRRAIVKKLLL